MDLGRGRRREAQELYIEHLEELQLWLALLVARHGVSDGRVMRLTISESEAHQLRTYVRSRPSVIVTAEDDGFDITVV